ncbi:hypothetical protein ACVPOY_07775 [Staphylococcus aureus]
MDFAKVDNKQHVSLVGMNDGAIAQPMVGQVNANEMSNNKANVEFVLIDI